MGMPEPDFYFAVGMSKEELLPPYDPSFYLEKVNNFHRWLHTKNHLSIETDSEIKYDSYKYIRPLIQNSVSYIGVCGSYEDLCITNLTLLFLNFRFDVYVPKKYIFRSYRNFGSLLERLSQSSVSIDIPFFSSSNFKVAELLEKEKRNSIISNHAISEISAFGFGPNFNRLVSSHECEDFFYFTRND